MSIETTSLTLFYFFIIKIEIEKQIVNELLKYFIKSYSVLKQGYGFDRFHLFSKQCKCMVNKE